MQYMPAYRSLSFSHAKAWWPIWSAICVGFSRLWSSVKVSLAVESTMMIESKAHASYQEMERFLKSTASAGNSAPISKVMILWRCRQCMWLCDIIPLEWEISWTKNFETICRQRVFQLTHMPCVTKLMLKSDMKWSYLLRFTAEQWHSGVLKSTRTILYEKSKITIKFCHEGSRFLLRCCLSFCLYGK